MKKVKLTTHNGWDCVPELKRAVYTIDHLNNDIEEIISGERITPLNYLVENMKESLQEALEILKNIDVKVEYKTVDNH